MVSNSGSEQNVIPLRAGDVPATALEVGGQARAPRTAEEVLAWQPPAPGSVEVSDYAQAKLKRLLASDQAHVFHRARIRVPGYTEDIPGLSPDAQDQARRASSMRWVHDQLGVTSLTPDAGVDNSVEAGTTDVIDVRSLEVGKLENGRMPAGKIAKSAGIPCPSDLVARTADGGVWRLVPVTEVGPQTPVVHLRDRARLTIPSTTLGILGLRHDSAVLLGSAPGVLILMPLSKFGINIHQRDVA